MARTSLLIVAAVLLACGPALAADNSAATTQPASTQPAAAAPTTHPENLVTVSVGDKVAVHYTGTLEDGTVFDSSKGKEPLRFTVGAGQMIPGFDKGVRGMAVGEKKEIKLPPAEAYGERNERNVAQVPAEKFGENLPKLKVGMKIGIRGRDGRPVPVTIAKIEKEWVTIDANHELAGKTLVFNVEMVEIKKD